MNYQINGTKAIYTLSDEDGLPILIRNNHDFKDENGLAPKVGEKILTLFTKPLYAMKIIHSSGLSNLRCLCIKNQEEFDFVKMVAREEGADRLSINMCILSNEPHDRIIPIIALSEVDDFEKWFDIFNKTEKCDICFNQQKILKELGPENSCVILSVEKE